MVALQSLYQYIRDCGCTVVTIMRTVTEKEVALVMHEIVIVEG